MKDIRFGMSLEKDIKSKEEALNKTNWVESEETGMIDPFVKKWL